MGYACRFFPDKAASFAQEIVGDLVQVSHEMNLPYLDSSSCKKFHIRVHYVYSKALWKTTHVSATHLLGYNSPKIEIGDLFKR